MATYVPTEKDILMKVLDRLHALVETRDTCVKRVCLRRLADFFNEEFGYLRDKAFSPGEMFQAAMELRELGLTAFKWHDHLDALIMRGPTAHAADDLTTYHMLYEPDIQEKLTKALRKREELFLLRQAL